MAISMHFESLPDLMNGLLCLVWEIFSPKNQTLGQTQGGKSCLFSLIYWFCRLQLLPVVNCITIHKKSRPTFFLSKIKDNTTPNALKMHITLSERSDSNILKISTPLILVSTTVFKFFVFDHENSQIKIKKITNI
jgi:hypothetical protein